MSTFAHFIIIMVARLLALFAISGLLFSQPLSANGKIDSLDALLTKPGLSLNDSAQVLSQLGYEYWTVDPQKSVQYGRQALRIAVERDLDEIAAFSYRVIGVAYWALGDYPIALQNMLESLERYEKLHDRAGVGSMQMNIGLVYSDQRSYEDAKESFKAGIAIFNEFGENGKVATSYTKIASVLSAQDSLSQAMELLHKAIEIHRANNFNYGLAEAYNRLGIVYRKTGDFEASLDYLYRSRDLSIAINDIEGLAKCHGDIGFTKLAQKDFENARQHFEESIAISKKIGSKKWMLEGLRGLARYFEETGEPKMALEYYKKYQGLKDSVLSERSIMTVANLREEYHSREQVRELQASRVRVLSLQRETRQKNQLLTLLSFGGLLAFITIILGFRNYRLREAKQKAEIENSRLKSEELEQDLEKSQRELTSYALNFLQKNELIADLKTEINGLKPTTEIVRLRKKLQQANTLDKDWEKFRMQFDKVHGSFTKDLYRKHPDLSPAEIKHCTLIRINLNIKECASILGISPDSAKTGRHRIRKKLGLVTEISIYEYLLKLGN